MELLTDETFVTLDFAPPSCQIRLEAACEASATYDCFVVEICGSIPGCATPQKACVEISINSHLLTGHCVEIETCRNFTDSLGTFRDNDELDNNENQEDYQPDYELAAAYKITECFDNFTRIGVE